MPVAIRQALLSEVSLLTDLIVRSTKELQAAYYTPKQLEGALGSAFDVDAQLIRDGTYFVAEADKHIAGCGGWSKRAKLFGADAVREKNDAFLNPRTEAARIRAFFIDPAWARKGVGSLLMRRCEAAALAQGFSRLELAATLAGVPFYLQHGFISAEDVIHPLPNGEDLRMVHMRKTIA